MALAKELDTLYRSPAREEMVRSEVVPANFNEYRADVFSLGVCIALLMFTGYPSAKVAASRKNFTEILAHISQYTELHQRLSLMLELDDGQRCDFVQLKARAVSKPQSLLQPAEVPKSAGNVLPNQKPAGNVIPNQKPGPAQPDPKTFAYRPIQPKTDPQPPQPPKPQFQQPGVGQFGPSAGNDQPKSAQSAQPKTFRPVAPSGPDILGGQPDIPKRRNICKQCGSPFDKRYSANIAGFEDQFENFCSEDCVTMYTIGIS